MLIDSHQHFWRYNPAEYGWIGDDMVRLRRDFLPLDLKRETAAEGIDGVVSVQARQTVQETEWLLSLAREHPFIRGVVGWVPLSDAKVEDHLARFAADPKLRAVRHVLQGEAPAYMLRDDFNRGVAAIEKFGLAYDVLIYERQIPEAIRFVDLHPRQRFVLDHAAKPRIRDNEVSPWREDIRELAQRENVACKLSGMVTEAGGSWSEAAIKTYIEIVMDAFGPGRLMFGSDWPVCLAACGYGRWHAIVRGAISRLSQEERDRVLGGTAVEAYGLKEEAP